MSTLPKYQQNQQTITFDYPHRPLQLSILTPSIIRVFANRGETGQSYAIEDDKQQPTDYDLTVVAHQYVLTTSDLTVKLDADGHVDVYDAAGHALITDFRGERHLLDKGVDKVHQKLVEAEGHSVTNVTIDDHASYYQVVKELAADEHLYGLGDKTGYLDKRGFEYDNWNIDYPDPQLEILPNIYKSIPVLLGLKNGHPYGLFFDNPYKSHLDLGKESNHYYFYSAVAGNLDYYILGGATLKAIVTNYTYLTGRTPLPQKWTLGYQQSRWGYSASQAEVQAIADNLREKNLPCDAIHFDVDYMRGYRVFTWDRAKYADPAKFVAHLKQQGFKVVPIIDPGVKQDPDYTIYQEGLQHDYFVKTPAGETYINKVWPGNSAFPDFGRPAVRHWWAQNTKVLTDTGVAGIWNDMNEPASFDGEIPLDTVFSDQDTPATHKKMHNVYGHNMARATYAGLKEHQGTRPFVITRAAYAGTQKYSTVWTGDNRSMWPHLQMMIPQLCNLGLSGFSFAGTDIGGFASDSSAELLTRWIEAAIFSPLLRNHAAMGTRHQEPWSFGEPTLSIYRRYLKLRYRFIPFLYDLFADETQTGLPIMRPLVLNYPADQRVRNLDDEFMVGDSLLVAPIVQKSQTKRLVYLPAGDWIDFWNNQEYRGEQDIVVAAPLDKLPLFVKKGTVLPWGPAVSYISDEPDTTMTFKLYGNTTTYQHYQDNGTDFAYQDGHYNRYTISVTDGQVQVRLTHHGFEPVYQTIQLDLADHQLLLHYDAATASYQA
ncbi:glycoside hydrolase family 31 protein [Levilactobacillus tongjiangensis]|uniref:Glycoside hydrolase family 31 protein n=1 Tax=Levilactobacillus tongjiangensis TaxID=2486023 RepID=A0ABW1SQ45_9LACO|nr:glycoside hydrolase family 31 protein [Levilactobacillus tongjiangensis]